MNIKSLKVCLYGLLTIIIGVLAFFIMYNAHWLINDDAVIIQHTGWGHYFYPEEEVFPRGGRFFPFVYMMYNVLALFGLTSVNAHFALHTIVFVVFCVVSLWASYKAVETNSLNWQDHILIFSAVIVCIARAYMPFLDGFTTSWFTFMMIMIWALCCFYVHTCKSICAFIIGLLTISYMTFCLENNFIYPLSYGVIGLLFIGKKSSRLEKAYMWCLIAVALVFLVLYFCIVFFHIETPYDGAHEEDITIIRNALRMFSAQKILWIVLVLVCWRAYSILVKKEEFEFWDVMLLTGCAYCCGCAILRLNWVIYYTSPSLFMMLAVVHYTHKYLGSKYAWILMLGLALFTFRRVPHYIQDNQCSRNGVKRVMDILKKEENAGNTLYWFAPYEDKERIVDGDWEWIDWLFFCTKTQIGYLEGNEQYDLKKIIRFDRQKGVFILPTENNGLFPGVNDTVVSAGEVLNAGDMHGFYIVKVQ